MMKRLSSTVALACVLAFTACGAENGPGEEDDDRSTGLPSITGDDAGTASPGADGGTTAPGAAATTYHVAPNGDDKGPGTALRPFGTLQRAADAVRPGDTVLVRPGRYRGFNVEDKHGTAAAPILFRGEAGVVVDQPGPMPGRPPKNTALGTNVWPRWPFGINLQRVSHVILEGFEVRGMPGRLTDGGKLLHRGGAGIRIEVCRHVTVRKNATHDNGRWGIFSGFCDDLLVEQNQASGSQLEHGIYLSNSGDRPIVRGNEVWGNHGAGIQINADNNFDHEDYARFATVDGQITGAIVERNQIRNNGAGGSAAINLDGVSDSRIVDNTLADNHATGIALYQVDGATASQRNEILDNRITMAADSRWAVSLVGCEPGQTREGACTSANLAPSGTRPVAAATGSTGNVLRRNVILTRSRTAGSILIDARSLRPDAKSSARFESNDNILVDRMSIEGNIVTLAEWRSRTGQDSASKLGAP